MPVMGITAVGKDMVRDAKYFRLACRIIAELGAQYVKTYYVEKDFETVTASCPVPIVMAGGKKLPELEALTMAYNAVQQGAAGVDMGRNIFQSDAPKAMIAAVARRRAQEHEARRGARAVQVAQGEEVARRSGSGFLRPPRLVCDDGARHHQVRLGLRHAVGLRRMQGAPFVSTDDWAQPVKAMDSPSGPSTANSKSPPRRRNTTTRPTHQRRLSPTNSTALVTISGLKGF